MGSSAAGARACGVTVVPANEAPCAHLQAIFGARGSAARCRCQRYRLSPGESFASTDVADRAHRLRQQTACGDPHADGTSGLLAYLDGEPVGWCAVEPRVAYGGLVRNGNRAAWAGRTEDRTDPGVWAVTCFVTRTGFRRRGVATALTRAAVAYARDRGARALEGYPMTTTEAIDEELHVGTARMFADAGFQLVAQPSPRRVVMRIEL
ncbi:GNAT family N-acetyltransferase [Cellulomonas aerilata]|nr:GNAT family N-acetyltransferase [Cellulomonas aerilata]